MAVDVDAEEILGLAHSEARGAAQVAVGVLAVAEGEAVDAVVGLVVGAAIVEEASDEAGLWLWL